MSRSLSAILPPLLAVLMLASCVSPRKAEQRDRKRADRHIAKAIAIYPGVLKSDSTTIAFHLPGEKSEAPARYTEPQVDSLLAVCEQYAAALASERELHILAEEIRLRNGQKPAAPAASPQRHSAVEHIRQQVCQFEPIVAGTSLCRATVLPGTNGPLLQIEQLPLDSILKADCPPQVPFAPCDRSHISPHWITGFFILLILCIVLALFLWNLTDISFRAKRNET